MQKMIRLTLGEGVARTSAIHIDAADVRAFVAYEKTIDGKVKPITEVYTASRPGAYWVVTETIPVIIKKLWACGVEFPDPDERGSDA